MMWDNKKRASRDAAVLPISFVPADHAEAKKKAKDHTL